MSGIMQPKQGIVFLEKRLKGLGIHCMSMEMDIIYTKVATGTVLHVTPTFAVLKTRNPAPDGSAILQMLSFLYKANMQGTRFIEKTFL